MQNLKIHLDDDDGAVVRFGPVVYVVWRNHDTQAPIPLADEAIASMQEDYGSGRQLFYVHRSPAGGQAGRLSGETRKAVMEHFERHETLFKASALCIEASGFSGSIVRSITTGILMLRRSEMKTETFDDARDGVRWLCSLTDRNNHFDVSDFVSALEQGGFSKTD